MSLPRTSLPTLRPNHPSLSVLGVLQDGQGNAEPRFPDPAEAADQLIQLRRQLLIDAGPHNFPVLMLYNDKTSMLAMGEDSRFSANGNGWSVLKTVEWARAYARSMKATRFELNIVSYAMTSPIMAKQRTVPATVAIVSDITRGQAIRSLTMLGDPEGNTIDGFADTPLDLSIFDFLTRDILYSTSTLQVSSQIQRLMGADADQPFLAAEAG